jgi:hypothetical protein
MSDTIRVICTVYFDPDTESVCHCKGDFIKRCPLRIAGNLPCKESVLSITPVDREEAPSTVSDAVSSLDDKLHGLADSLKDIAKRGRIF